MTEELKKRIVAAVPKQWGWVLWEGELQSACHFDGVSISRIPLCDAEVALTLLDDMWRDVLSIYPDGDGWCVGIPHSRFIGENLPIAIAKAWLSLRERCPKCRKLLRECPNCSVGCDG